MALPGVRAEHAAAVRAVNAAFNRLTPAVQESIEIEHDGLEAEIDTAILAEDRTRALAAIRAWRGHWLGQIKRADR